MPAMRIRGCLLLVVLAASSCDEPDPSAACHGERPVRIAATDNLAYAVRTTPTDTFVALTRDYGQDDVRTLVGPDCGVPPRDLGRDIVMLPASVRIDPDDDDPDLVCDERTHRFYRVDPIGDQPPALVLPYLRCDAVLKSAHGPVIGGLDVYWLVPDFPDDSTAVKLGERVHNITIVGDSLIYTTQESALRRVDLATREDRELHPNALMVDATATHVLWRAFVDADTAPMSVHDLARGADHYVGLWRREDDDLDTDLPYRSTPRWGWRFDPSGRSVTHVPFAATTPMEAFDLEGEPVAFPAWGTPLHALADGAHVIVDGERVLLARPGDDATITLDWTYGPNSLSFAAHGDALEVQMDSDLYRVPLDGGPRVMIARDIGARREWLDADHIVTIFADVLTVVRVGANFRHRLGRARSFVHIPDRGVYFNNVLSYEQPDNGVWFVPEAALRPRPPTCITSYYCR